MIWQNLRLAVLWDLSYILENSYRISLGDVPYRDFPFPYAPLTFVIQALLIKVGGRVYFHHVLYAAIVGGAATVIAWRILLNMLRGAALPSARLVAFLLSVPLLFLEFTASSRTRSTIPTAPSRSCCAYFCSNDWNAEVFVHCPLSSRGCCS